MADLSKDEVKSLGRAVGLEIEEPLLTEVTYNLNALGDLLEEANPPGLDQVEPLPISPPHERSWHEQAEIPFLSATALGELIRNKDVSPREATETYLERIAAVDGTLHSYITVCRDEALRAAREAEQALARGNYRGPLHGVPFAVKDQFWTKAIRPTPPFPRP